MSCYGESESTGQGSSDPKYSNLISSPLRVQIHVAFKSCAFVTAQCPSFRYRPMIRRDVRGSGLFKDGGIS